MRGICRGKIELNIGKDLQFYLCQRYRLVGGCIGHLYLLSQLLAFVPSAIFRNGEKSAWLTMREIKENTNNVVITRSTFSVVREGKICHVTDLPAIFDQPQLARQAFTVMDLKGAGSISLVGTYVILRAVRDPDGSRLVSGFALFPLDETFIEEVEKDSAAQPLAR